MYHYISECFQGNDEKRSACHPHWLLGAHNYHLQQLLYVTRAVVPLAPVSCSSYRQTLCGQILKILKIGHTKYLCI